jgi:hypothetical protein
MKRLDLEIPFGEQMIHFNDEKNKERRMFAFALSSRITHL